ncbi:MAG: hypothetical protein IPO72_12055 [Saprospiraceae bacterium]|nr:hypothetical protein [Candidatus Vicinibacter affinis]
MKRTNGKFGYCDYITFIPLIGEHSIYIDGLSPFHGVSNESANNKSLLVSPILHCNIGLGSIESGQEIEVVRLAFYIKSIISKISAIFELENIDDKYRKQQLRTAIISILVDSYAHNISAHSLSALQWWFRQRSEETFEKKIFLKKFPKLGAPKGLNISRYELDGISYNGSKDYEDGKIKYYDQLGLSDQSNTRDFVSLMDYIRSKKGSEDSFNVSGFLEFSESANLFENEYVKYKKNAALPFPIDYAIWPFLKYLRDKGAFWSGVLGDNQAIPGEVISFYDLLWEDFAQNPLFLGTIAHTEGIHKINIHILIEEFDKDCSYLPFVSDNSEHVKYEEKIPCKLKSKFVTIDLGLLSQKGGNSNLSFVTLGDNFKLIREKLQTMKVFLPGGIVGKHAFFTILENSLRNIKHYIVIDINEIDLCISIQPSVLYQQHEHCKEPLNNLEDSHQLFKIGVWIDLPMAGDRKIREERFKEVTLKSLDSLIDEDGRPRMGGNAQDKACAGALLLQRFTYTEDFNNSDERKRELQQYYYPFTYYALENQECSKRLFITYPIAFPNSNQKFKDIYENYFKNKISDNVGVNFESSKTNLNLENGSIILKKYFYLWKGAEVYILNDSKRKNIPVNCNEYSDLIKKTDNLSRFKIIVLDLKEPATPFAELRKSGAVRIVKNFSTNKCVSLLECYKKWLENWIPINNENLSISKFIFKQENRSANCFNLELDGINYENSTDIEIILAHGGLNSGKGDVCDVRSHGRLLQDIFRNPNIEEALTNDNKINELDKLELFETLATKVLIIDNRINNLISTYNNSKKEKILSKLNLEIKKEDYIKDDLVTNLKSYHIAIIHLTWLEKIGYSEENLDQIFNDCIGSNIPDNFILAITTGRGRDNWKSNEKIDKYRKNMLHIPAESLQAAVESAISYKDDYQIKNNILKIIFGS